MDPSTVAVIMFLLVLSCCISYYWMVPDSIDPSKQKQNILLLNKDNDGYWGKVTSSFNWCEYNYLYFYYVAEPMNSFSSLLYCIGVYIHYNYYSFLLPNYLIYLLIIVFVMGAGSTLFHGTLKYETQIIDEIPMYLMAGYGSVVFYSRNDDKINQFGTYYQFTASILMGIIFLFTEESNILHLIGRFYLNTFLLWFVYVFIAANNTSNEIDKILKNNMISTYFTKSFIYFIIALICWLLDNFMCDTLQNLPYGIPYLHLHSLGWHLGTVLGLHHILMILIAQEIYIRGNRNKNKYKVKSKSVAFGLLSYLEISSA